MRLSDDDVTFFYETWLPLLRWVNERKAVVPGKAIVTRGDNDIELLRKVRDALWADDALLDTFVAENPAGLSPRALGLVASWRHRRAGTFVVFRELAKYTVVIDEHAPKTAYAVLGLRQPIADMVPWMPCFVKTVMLPFEGRIIFDGLLEVYSVHLGPGVRRHYDEIYRTCKSRIVTGLTAATAPTNVIELRAPDAPSPPRAPEPAAAAKKKPSKRAAVEKAPVNPGRCEACGEVVSKRAMTGHLARCAALLARSTKGKPTTVYRIVAESPGAPMYWLYLDVPSGAKLSAIDSVLRDVWLECCGHLSAFTIGGVSYSSQPMDDGWSPVPDRAMTAKVSAVAGAPTWRYEYDFGTTTELRLRVVGSHTGPGGRVRLVARNVAPTWPCVACGAPATEICAQCFYDDNGWLCERCAKKHECGEDYLLPVVNSPRTGQCAYAG